MSSQAFHVAPNVLMPAADGAPLTESAVVVADWPRRLLLVVDGSFESDGAFTAALGIAGRTAASVDVIVAYAPRIPLPSSPDRAGSARCEPGERRGVARALRAARDRLHRMIPARVDRERWTMSVEIGDPGTRLVALAEQERSDLAIVGIRQRELLDERAGGLTAVCAARYLDVPLLAAARDYAAPARAVVAFPDGRLHGPTVRATLACVAGGATIYRAFPGPHPAASAIDANDFHFVNVDIDGDMLTGTLNLANDVGATLIAAPNAGPPGPVRSFLPNLAEPLLVAATCSVLVVPD